MTKIEWSTTVHLLYKTIPKSTHMLMTSVDNLPSKNEENRIFVRIIYMAPDCCSAFQFY